VIISVLYLLVRCLLGCLMVLARHRVSKDAELLVLRQENAMLRRQVGLVRYEPGDRLWLLALSRLVPRRRWGEVAPAHLNPESDAASAASRPDSLRERHRPRGRQRAQPAKCRPCEGRAGSAVASPEFGELRRIMPVSGPLPLLTITPW
jgi:hypothetical protein